MAQWLDNAIFYEIYPQSFKDTNSDGIGDFNGIIEKLDYIRELGCNAIWMNPCFESPFGDAGYDVADYYKAAPRYGTNDDLKRLFDEVHKRDMHLLLDLVPGHTSVEHKWFLESMKAEKNEFSDRYVWTDNIWESPEGMGCLRGISDRNGSCAVNFFSSQPALNYGFYKPERPWQQPVDAPGPQATVAELKNIMRFWLGLGCDGFRVDMAGSLVKQDEDGKGTIRLWQDIRAFLDEEFPDAAMISEWGEPDKSLQGGFHMDFLLHFGPSHYNDLFRCEEPYFSGRGKGDAGEFVKKYKENYDKTAGKGLICIPSGNHDMARLSAYLQGDELKMAFAFLLSMPGAPFIYYGDEIGMRYVENLTSVEGGYDRTGSRSPMQWDNTVNAGFSCAVREKLYIPLDSSPDRPTVQEQMADPDSLYHEIRRLIALRQAHPALQSKGRIDFIHAESHSYPLVYLRSTAEEQILVLINPSDTPAVFECTLPLSEKLYSFGRDITAGEGKISVPAGSYGFYRTSPIQ
jgi:Glycosidases